MGAEAVHFFDEIHVRFTRELQEHTFQEPHVHWHLFTSFLTKCDTLT